MREASALALARLLSPAEAELLPEAPRAEALARLRLLLAAAEAAGAPVALPEAGTELLAAAEAEPPTPPPPPPPPPPPELLPEAEALTEREAAGEGGREGTGLLLPKALLLLLDAREALPPVLLREALWL
jgi:hypothetical protein